MFSKKRFEFEKKVIFKNICQFGVNLKTLFTFYKLLRIILIVHGYRSLNLCLLCVGSCSLETFEMIFLIAKVLLVSLELFH